MVLMTLVVPDGLYPGDAMSVMAGDQEFTITVPDGVGPGMEIKVDLPVAEEGGPSDGPPPPQNVEIIVPDGCWPGMEFTGVRSIRGRGFKYVRNSPVRGAH